MITPPEAARLEAVLRRESRSLLQYVRESFPWVRHGKDEALSEVQRIIGEDRDALGSLSAFMARQRHPVISLGAYPMRFTSMNFVSLEYLVPQLLQEGRKAVADLERDAGSLHGEAREEIERLLDLKRKHLGQLEALLAAQARPAALVS